MKTLLNVMMGTSLAIVAALTITGCTYNVSMAHTQGTATDTIDDTASNTPSATVSLTPKAL